jgi:RNA polymerase sigma-70 factor, ECF subfamily
MSDRSLGLARSGDADAFQQLTQRYRRELQVHCYRILGSTQDAEDALQETLTAAWRAFGTYTERGSLRAWLYRTATNKCLDMLRGDMRREPEFSNMSSGDEFPEPTEYLEVTWFEPYPDALLEQVPDQSPGPEARYEGKEAISLAFVTALQHLPPRQRAALLLRDVLGFRAGEVAGMLETTEASIHSALQRARQTIDARLPPGRRERAPLPDSPAERGVIERFVEAFENGRIDDVIALLTEDATFTMPPEPLQYQGHEAIARFLANRFGWRGSQQLRLIPTRANNQPAFGCYLADPHSPIARSHGIIVLALAGEHISAITRFLDNSVLRLFGLPRTIRNL